MEGTKSVKKNVPMVIVIPVGPACIPEYIQDTIDSIRFYCHPATEIILVDDSGKDIERQIGKSSPPLHILKTPQHNGKEAGLYYTLCQGFRFAYESINFDILLRMDTDALIIGKTPELDAIEYFKKNPSTGLIGAYKYNHMHEKRNYNWAKRQLFFESSYLSFFYRKDAHDRILMYRLLLEQATKHGYEYGEHCLGGAYFMSYECVKKLHMFDLVPMNGLESSRLQEDMIMGLLVSYVGLKMGDFATDRYPMGLNWKGLPCSPEELIKKRKKIVHSTRFFESTDESEIRGYFNKIRK